jgi:polyhydroxyalkanoate synthase
MADGIEEGGEARAAVARAEEVGKLVERAARLYARVLEAARADDGFQVPDPGVVTNAFTRLGQAFLEHPQKLADAQTRLARDWTALLHSAARRVAGEEVEPIAAPDKADRRFQDQAWSENLVFDFVKQSYLLGARWLQDTVRQAPGLDAETQRKIDFYTRQYVDALSPTNFLFTNPKAIRETVDTSGDNLVRGWRNLIADLERGKGRLAISQTDLEAYEVGRDVAVSPGKVILQTDLAQLIQYEPLTETAHRRPLLIIPPWINKFYILDLRPQNSFIRWAVGQGHTVFVLSWVNPDEKLSAKTFADYMREGPLAALDAMEKATGEREANVIGYCLGGTLLAATLAWMAAKGDDRFKSATFFTALTDFREAGEVKVFIDEEQLQLLEKHMARKGYLEAHHMAQVFNMMRDNDLIWSYVERNYLMGKEPPAFDLLYWNADATRMPAMMHGFYLRNMYQQNLLVQPGEIELLGERIDMRKIALPCYFLSTREDHIAPWRATYAATQLVSGPKKFVLAASGHIAGVINPPGGRKYGHWTRPDCPPEPDEWLAGAEAREGSWWPDWSEWIAGFGGGLVPARKPGDRELSPIEDAPGAYAKVRAEA